MKWLILKHTEHEKINTGGGRCDKGIALGKKDVVKDNVAEYGFRGDCFDWAAWMDLEEAAAEHVLQAVGEAEQAEVWLQKGGWWDGVGGEEGGVRN